MSEVVKYFPVSFVVGMSEIAFGDLASNAEVITIGRKNIQAQHGAGQAVSPGQLCEQHHFEQLMRVKRDDFVIASIAIDTGLKSPPRQQCHDLRENHFAFVHLTGLMMKFIVQSIPISNRYRSFVAVNSYIFNRLKRF